jgi:hypothetical protein
VRNWCKLREWKTLGAFLQNAGGMSLEEFLAVENLGRKSAVEVLAFFDVIKGGRRLDLRKFLPLAMNTISISLAEALNDLVSSLDDRDVRILEMRLVGGSRLEAIARNFNCTRELVRQKEERFVCDVERAVNWFSDERIELWHVWETTHNLSSALADKGIVVGTLLVAAAISSVFEKSAEGKFLQDNWRETFRTWARELILSERLSSGGINLVEYAKEKGRQELAPRFQSWLEKNLGNGLALIQGRVTRSQRELTSHERRLLYGAESTKERWRDLCERLNEYRDHRPHTPTRRSAHRSSRLLPHRLRPPRGSAGHIQPVASSDAF